MNDSFALLISSIMINSTTALEDAEFRNKKVVERLVSVSKNYMNPSNRSQGRTPKLEDQYLVNQNLDGMFELVQDYCPKEMDDYCSMIFFCNMQGLAKKYEKEITDIAVKRILKLVAEEKIMSTIIEQRTQELAENERYTELKQIDSKINLNKGLKTTVSTLISEMEKPLKTAQESHYSIIRQTNKALTAGYFVTNANEFDPRVLEFLNNDFKKYSNPESTM